MAQTTVKIDSDWRDRLKEWRQTNPIVTPPDLVKLRDEFNQRFPKDNLEELTLDDYALGRSEQFPDNFCHFIEFKTKELGNIGGGAANKHGVYWSNKDQDWRWNKFFNASTEIEAFEQIRDGLMELVDAVEKGAFDELDQIADHYLGKNNNVTRGKPLYLYYPDQFIPIYSKKELNDWLDFFELPKSDGSLVKNRRLFTYLKALPEFTGFDSWGIMRFLYGVLYDASKPAPPDQDHNPVLTWEMLQAKTGHNLEFLTLVERAIKRKKQIIFTGCPGSGKTYLASQFAQYFTSNSDGFIEVVQFHTAYAYEDFIQGLRPRSDENNQLVYQVVPGRFLEFCAQASRCKGDCVLIIDEINRANLASVFGELMYLLEYRDRHIKLAGSSQEFQIPNNVYLIGTMNTADRSIALVDHALRRRFAFIELHPDYGILRRWHQEKQSALDIENLINLLHKVNQAIGDRHYHLGISYFLDENLEENLSDIWALEIFPYLEEVFYDSPDKLAAFAWENIQDEIYKEI